MSDEQKQSTMTVDVEAGEQVAIGEDVVVELVAKSGRRARLRLHVMSDMKILRSPVDRVQTSMAT